MQFSSVTDTSRGLVVTGAELQFTTSQGCRIYSSFQCCCDYVGFISVKDLVAFNTSYSLLLSIYYNVQEITGLNWLIYNWFMGLIVIYNYLSVQIKLLGN